MKTQPVWLAIPAVLLAGLIVLLAAFPPAADWPRQPLFHYFPLGLLALAVVLGSAFTQTRVAFFALLAATAVAAMDHAYFGLRDSARGDATLFLASVMVPVHAAVFHRLNERGLFTPYGATRVVAVGIGVVVLLLLPWLEGFKGAVAASAPPSFRTAGGWWRLPGLGVLAGLASLPFLALPRKGESPRLGPLLTVALVFLMLAFNFQSNLWRPAQQQTALLCFATLAAAFLVSAVLESVWRHMNIDELTDLPGRRPFRHHLRCLAGEYTLAIVDIDHFKRINDTHGHAAGDQVLKFLAAELSGHAAGAVYRYGGEEFVIIYKEGTYEQVLNNLDDLREAVSRKLFYLRGENRPESRPRVRQEPEITPLQIALTVSIGAARGSERHAGPQAVLDAADQALYRAKEQGRNRVCYMN